ncbi:choline transporter-like 1 isoform X1 [Hermetia illucens]|uniref:choline transporter-like 1 isoform X1 n=1 Tax=Hermetia illucens TaxID=343691 RepID=UPI0018CBFFCD|nr:choline transporter-like 1 isoform X1 [Hermetia illucens]
MRIRQMGTYTMYAHILRGLTINIVVAIFSFVYGSPHRILKGTDSFGNICGVSHNEKYKKNPLSGLNMIDRPDLFFLDFQDFKKALKICVKSCPEKNITNSRDLHRYHIRSENNLCRYDFNASYLSLPISDNINYFNNLGPCPRLPVYESHVILHKCIPKLDTVTEEHFKREMFNSWSIIDFFLIDLYYNWISIILIVILASVLSSLIIACLYWLTSIISWCICGSTITAVFFFNALLWWTYYTDSNDRKNRSHANFQNEIGIFVLSALSTIVMIAGITIVYLLRSKLEKLAKILEKAGTCLSNLPSIFILPFLALLMIFMLFSLGVYVIACLASSGYPQIQSTIPINSLADNETNFSSDLHKFNTKESYRSLHTIDYVDAYCLRKMIWFYIFGLFWLIEFVFAGMQLTIAGVVAHWYFGKYTKTPITHIFKNLIKYHLGSIAKGSLLITIFQPIRIMLTYSYTRLKRKQIKGSRCAGCGLQSCVCCFWVLDKFIRYLNSDAYAVIAVESINLYPAGGIAWNSIVSGSTESTALRHIADFVLLLAKFLVAIFSSFMSVLLLRGSKIADLSSLLWLFSFALGFLIGKVLLTLYKAVIDTLSLCDCERKIMNNQSRRWPLNKNVSPIEIETAVGTNETVSPFEMTLMMAH